MFKECPHCLIKVMFPENGNCPSCGKNKNNIPIKRREDIVREQAQKEMERQIAFYKKRGPRLLVGGLALTLSALLIFFLAAAGGNLGFLWTGGMLVGLGMATRGFADLTAAKEVKIKYDKKNK